ncbi:uncharacterized protein LOC134659706 [Cydia amplana]|uniref:uncharacterized protein LOC134659706 n=1 Tax=Cydia amplana TaxID=1869771 RepID=UPI002FE5A4F3
MVFRTFGRRARSRRQHIRDHVNYVDDSYGGTTYDAFIWSNSVSRDYFEPLACVPISEIVYIRYGNISTTSLTWTRRTAGQPTTPSYGATALVKTTSSSGHVVPAK